jgi:uncharacterized integral membrane protein
MRLYIVSALVIAFLAILFALQNNNLVTVYLFWGEYRQSLAVVLLVTLAIGVMVGLLVSMPALMRRGWRVTRLQKQTDSLTEQIQEREQTLAAESRKVQAIHDSYRSLLTTLDLIEPTTGLLHQSQLSKALGRQMQHLQAEATSTSQKSGEPTPSLSVLMLQVNLPPLDGTPPQQMWRAIAQTLQRQASVDTWFYSDGEGLYVAATPGLDSTATSRYGETLQQTILDQPPVLADGRQVVPEVSVGGAFTHAIATLDAPQLLETAQTALSQAQQRGKNRLRVLETAEH